MIHRIRPYFIHYRSQNNYMCKLDKGRKVQIHLLCKAIDEAIHFLTKQTTSLHLIAHKKAKRLSQTERLQTNDAIHQIVQMINQKYSTNKAMGSQNNIRVSSSIQQQHSSQNINQSFTKQTQFEKRQTLKTPPTQIQLRQGVQCVIDEEYYITYYGVIDPKQLISHILVDDGFLKRQHRQVLFNKKLNYIGIGIHQHPTQYFVVVIAMANFIRNLKRQDNQNNQYLCGNNCDLI